MDNIHKIFVTALKDVLEDMPRGTKKALAEHLNIGTGHMSDMLSNRRGSTEEQRRTIVQKLQQLGLMNDYEDFLSQGQKRTDNLITEFTIQNFKTNQVERYLKNGTFTVDMPPSEKAPSPEVAGYLDQARAVLEGGGKKAETLRNMLDLMKE